MADTEAIGKEMNRSLNRFEGAPLKSLCSELHMDSLVVVLPAANLNETLKKYSLSSPVDTRMHGLLTYGQSECQFHVLVIFRPFRVGLVIFP